MSYTSVPIKAYEKMSTLFVEQWKKAKSLKEKNRDLKKVVVAAFVLGVVLGYYI